MSLRKFTRRELSAILEKAETSLFDLSSEGEIAAEAGDLVLALGHIVREARSATSLATVLAAIDEVVEPPEPDSRDTGTAEGGA